MGNVTEDAFRAFARQQKWSATKQGWPDFLCILPDGTIAAVEVKRRCTAGRSKGLFRLLRREQAKAMMCLKSYGIPCFVSDGVTIEPFEPDRHAPEQRRRKRGQKPYAWEHWKKMNLGEIQRGEEGSSAHAEEVPW